MTLGTLITTIISITFLYSVLALFTSELQEYLAAIFESRAKRLKQSIRQMLGEQDWPFYQLDSREKIPSSSKIWLRDGRVNFVTDNRQFIYINNSDNQKVDEADVIEDSLDSGNFYVKGDAVTKYPFYAEVVDSDDKVWAKPKNVILIKEPANLKSDEKSIWIKDNDSTEVREADVTLDTGTDNKGTSKIDSSVVTKYSVYTILDKINANAKVWLKDGIVLIPADTSSTSDRQFIWINDRDNTEVKEKETKVIEDSINKSKGNIKGDPIAQYRVYQASESITYTNNPYPFYSLDVINKQIIDNKNQTIVKLEDFKVDSLTEKFYQHRNIQALNQSGFAWLSLRKDPVFIICLILGLLALICSVFSLLSNNSILLLLSLLIFGATVLGFTLYHTKHEGNSRKIRSKNKSGKVRKSVGPSYIDADVFARTLIDVIRLNSTQGLHNKGQRLSTLKFYTPAKSVLQGMLETFENEKAKTGDEDKNPTTKELIDELIRIYPERFEEVQKRSSGVYKRNAKGLSFLIGLLIAILLNADTFNIVTQLTQADNNIIVTDVEKILKDGPQCSQNDQVCIEKKLSQLAAIYNKNINTLPLGWETAGGESGIAQVQKTSPTPDGQVQKTSPTPGSQVQKTSTLQEDIDEITRLTSIINDFNFGYFNTKDAAAETNCNIQKMVEKDQEVINAQKDVKTAQTQYNEAKSTDDKTTQQQVLRQKEQILEDQKIQAIPEAQKVCFEAVDSKLLEGINKEPADATNTKNVFALTPSFKNSILGVRNDNGIIDESKLPTFQKEYENFMLQKYQERSKLIVNLQNDPSVYPTRLTEQINTTVEKQGGWYKVPFGWLITAIALSMGAPFWFDLLSRIMNVRNAKKNGDTPE